jgi:hypothetical protein
MVVIVNFAHNTCSVKVHCTVQCTYDTSIDKNTNILRFYSVVREIFYSVVCETFDEMEGVSAWAPHPSFHR